ncbi:hypothetical protein KIPB_015256 [Kipferlia bialata]|uniref:Uncharacterized protein n=1 Tax=Kipferlia bialata TaxID=797122 RepID=A0A391NU49_9EUKA|nr:hypothetical protein KIPB_015256 [Kipferlia bialata]|eukprot:g15256.t1
MPGIEVTGGDASVAVKAEGEGYVKVEREESASEAISAEAEGERHDGGVVEQPKAQHSQAQQLKNEQPKAEQPKAREERPAPTDVLDPYFPEWYVYQLGSTGMEILYAEVRRECGWCICLEGTIIHIAYTVL